MVVSSKKDNYFLYYGGYDDCETVFEMCTQAQALERAKRYIRGLDSDTLEGITFFLTREVPVAELTIVPPDEPIIKVFLL